MFRTTNNDDEGLLKAYSSIYETVELNEEQIIESFNLWVDTLLEEGHDLSDYTYDGLYEYYLNEGGWGAALNLLKSGIKGGFKIPASQSIRSTIGRGAIKGGAENISKLARDIGGGVQNVVGGTYRGVRNIAAKHPLKTALGVGLAAYDLPKGEASLIRRATDAAGRTAGAAANAIYGNNTPSSGAAKPSPERKYIPPANLTQGVDILDIVKGHLINEGYANSDEAAFKIMAHMSDDWRTHIINLHSFNEV